MMLEIQRQLGSRWNISRGFWLLKILFLQILVIIVNQIYFTGPSQVGVIWKIPVGKKKKQDLSRLIICPWGFK